MLFATRTQSAFRRSPHRCTLPTGGCGAFSLMCRWHYWTEVFSLLREGPIWYLDLAGSELLAWETTGQESWLEPHRLIKPKKGKGDQRRVCLRCEPSPIFLVSCTTYRSHELEGWGLGKRRGTGSQIHFNKCPQLGLGQSNLSENPLRGRGLDHDSPGIRPPLASLLEPIRAQCDTAGVLFLY